MGEGGCVDAIDPDMHHNDVQDDGGDRGNSEQGVVMMTLSETMTTRAYLHVHTAYRVNTHARTSARPPRHTQIRPHTHTHIHMHAPTLTLACTSTLTTTLTPTYTRIFTRTNVRAQ